MAPNREPDGRHRIRPWLRPREADDPEELGAWVTICEADGRPLVNLYGEWRHWSDPRLDGGDPE
jgi:hypothetical protein